MFPIINIGPLAVQAPGLILLAGLWLGLSLAEKRAPRHQTNPGHLYNLVFTALIAGVIGARLAFVAVYPQAFAGNLMSLVSLNPGLLDPTAGLAVGVIAAGIYIQRKNLSLWPTLDALTLALAVMGTAVGLAHLASGDAFGAPADLPWAIELWGAARHPSQVYETILALVILGLVWTDEIDRPTGVFFLRFTAFTAGARLFLEVFRGDSVLVFGSLRVAQLAAWAALAVSLWLWGKRESEESGESKSSE